MIKNIIFDLGGVFIRIDFDLTVKAFSELAGLTFEETLTLMEKERFYDRVERGEFTPKEFCAFIRGVFGIKSDDSIISEAWNALLLDIELQKVNLLKELSSKYNLYVLSNTSEIHIQGLNNILNELIGVSNLNYLFDKVYYSFDIGLRKPELDIYKYVLKDANIKPEETLFLDDNMENLTSAHQLGINILHVKNYDTEEVLVKYLGS